LKIKAKIRSEQSHMQIRVKKDRKLHVDKEIVINAQVTKVKARTTKLSKGREEDANSSFTNKKQTIKVDRNKQRKVIHVTDLPISYKPITNSYIKKENIAVQSNPYCRNKESPIYVNRDYMKRINIGLAEHQTINEAKDNVRMKENMHSLAKNKTSPVVVKTVLKESVLEDVEGARDVYDGVQQISQPVRSITNATKSLYQYQRVEGLVKHDKRITNIKNKRENKEFYIKGGKKVLKDFATYGKKTKDFHCNDTKELKSQNTSSYTISTVKKEKKAENVRQYQKLKKQRITKFAMARLRTPSVSNSESAQSDTLGNLAKDLVKMKAMQVVRQATASLAALAAPVMLPILGFGFIILVAVTALYESPLAIFLPKIEPYEYGVECDDERSPQEVLEEYSQELDAEIAQLYSSYDEYSITYSPEDSFVGSNTKDILYAYMIKCGEDNDSLVMTDDNKELLKEIFNSMCSYTSKTSTRTETVENTEGQDDSSNQAEETSKESEDSTDKSTTKTIHVIDVKVTIQDLENYIKDNPLTSEENEWYVTLMEEDPNDFSDDEESNLEGVTVEGVPSEIGTKVAELALTKVGCEYSQSRRWEEGVYDCSSLVYRCYQEYGITLGASTAAGEAKWLTDKKCYFTSSDKLQAGDLIFYSSDNDNGRYRNISHVAIYIGNGKQVEAQNPSKGVRCNSFKASNINCYARPSLLLKPNKN
jgi:cell wall-associated NlpC family hydrolase